MESILCSLIMMDEEYHSLVRSATSGEHTALAF